MREAKRRGSTGSKSGKKWKETVKDLVDKKKSYILKIEGPVMIT